MQSETLTLPGHDEVRAQGIGAQLDLRGTSDVLSAPAIDGFEFCAPVIEEGGTSMLKKDAAKTKQCFEFVVNNVREGRESTSTARSAATVPVLSISSFSVFSAYARATSARPTRLPISLLQDTASLLPRKTATRSPSSRIPVPLGSTAT